MSEEKIFTDGLIFKLPHENAPTYVKGKLSIKTGEFKKFLDKHNKDGWVNIDLKVSTAGKAYAELDTWQPKADTEKTDTKKDDIDEIPF
jgi:hypothetical protein